MSLKEPLPSDEHVYEYIPIRVTSGILLHIGAGIYHSVAGALKELVSNSFDADAPQVDISTDYPNFEQIKIVDSGEGMTAKRFKQAMRSIGISLKGTVEKRGRTKEFRRPIIGRLGIGLMALSQVCNKAEIESQVKGSKTKFVATLDFSDVKKRITEQTQAAKLEILRDRVLDRFGDKKDIEELLGDRELDPDTRAEIQELLDLSKAAKQKLKEKTTEKPEGEHLGYFVIYPNLPAIIGYHGTTVTLKEIEPGVLKHLRDEGRSQNLLPEQYQEEGNGWIAYRNDINRLSWKELCEKLQPGTLHYQSLPEYHQFLWELALTTPVQYLPKAPVLVEPNLLSEKKKQLERFNFSLKVDNRELFKPILLPAGALTKEIEYLSEEFDYNVERFEFDGKKAGERLKYHGYIFWQKSQIKPTVLWGVEIYIRNVGIGLYDQTLLDFSNVNPTSRAGQISGEIYVEEGLERALNVDRNSFRVTDAHYMALQDHLWNVLGSTERGKGIIGKSVDAYFFRKEYDDKQSHKGFLVELNSQVKQTSNGRFTVIFTDSDKKAEPFEIKDNEIIVNDISSRWPRNKKERRLYQRILIPTEAALAAGVPARQAIDFIKKILLKGK